MGFWELRSFAGLAASCYTAVPFARLYTLALFDVLADYKCRYCGMPRFSLHWGLRGCCCKLGKPATKELAFWAALAWRDAETELIAPSAVSVLYTDASSYRWGVVLMGPDGCASERVSGDFPVGL